MIDLLTALGVLGGVFLLLMNGFFVVTEFAMTRVRQFDKSEFDESKGLQRAWEMTDRLEIYLSGCQVGITIASVGVGVVAEPAVAAVFHPIIDAVGLSSGSTTAVSAALALVIINLLHIIVGEQAPTYFGIERTKLAARYGSWVLYWWTKLMYPIITLADKAAKGLLSVFGIEIDRSWTEGDEDGEQEVASRADLHRRMGDVLAEIGDLPKEREEEILAALQIERVPVRSLMIPPEDIVALSTTEPIEENVRRMRENPVVRFPLIDGSLDEFRGIIYTPSVIGQYDELRDEEVSLTDIAHDPMTVAGDTSVADAIDLFQAQKQELALVLDGNDVVGLVTATDAFESVLGELEDPTDRELTA